MFLSDEKLHLLVKVQFNTQNNTEGKISTLNISLHKTVKSSLFIEIPYKVLKL